MVIRFIILIILLSACSSTERANRQLKKAERAIAKAEQLGAVVKPDTVFTDRTILIPEYRTDTLIKQVNFTDTIRIENERIKWKVKVNTVEKEIFVEAKCKADTVVIRVPVEVTRNIKSGYSLWEIIILAIVALVVGGVIVKIFWR